MSEQNHDLPLSLTPQETQGLRELQVYMRNLQTQIGGLEIQKAGKMGLYGQAQQEMNQRMVEIAQRLQIPAGVEWNVTPDGTVILLNDLQAQTVTAEPQEG